MSCWGEAVSRLSPSDGVRSGGGVSCCLPVPRSQGAGLISARFRCLFQDISQVLELINFVRCAGGDKREEVLAWVENYQEVRQLLDEIGLLYLDRVKAR